MVFQFFLMKRGNVEEFPSNSRNRAKAAKPEKQETKKVEKAVVGEVILRKKPLGKRLFDTFFGGDAQGVVGYVLMDVLVPAVKDVIVDAVSTGIERMIFGESSRAPSRRGGYRPGGSSGYVQYNRYSPSHAVHRREEPREISRRARATHDFDEILLATRAEAQEVLDRLFDLISQYEQATVSDLYELVGVSGNYADENWGWVDIRGTGITRTRAGYLLNLPRPELLKS